MRGSKCSSTTSLGGTCTSLASEAAMGRRLKRQLGVSEREREAEAAKSVLSSLIKKEWNMKNLWERERKKSSMA